MTVSLPIPRRIFYGDAASMMVGAVASLRTNESQFKADAIKDFRRVMGFPIAPWLQRELVWSEEQKVRFIISVYTGIYLGLFIYNEVLEVPELDGLLIDGQQRLSAIEEYLDDKFKVPGEDGKAYLWSELKEEHRAHFYRMPFGYQVVHITDRAKLVEMYNLLNFGGTPHKESDRAN